MADETLRIVFEGDTANLNSATQQASAEVSKFGQAASNVGSFISSNLQNAGIAAAGALASIGLVTKSALEQAAAYQQDRIAFENMLGSAEKARTLLSQLSDFAVKTPFQLPEVVSAGKELLAFGVAQGNVISTLTKVGDAAASVGVPIQQAIDVWSKAKAGIFDTQIFAPMGVTRESLEKFGIQFKNTGEVVNRSQLLPALERMWGSAGIAGMMAKQSGSLSGTMSNLQDDLTRFSIAVLGMGTNGDVRKGSIFYYVDLAAKEVLKTLDTVQPQIIAFVDSLLKNKDAVAAMFGVLGGLAAGVAAAFVVAFGPILLLVAAITAVGVGIALLVAHWQDVTHWVDEHRLAILALLAIIAPLPLAIGAIVVQVVKHWQDITQAFQSAWKNIADGLDWIKNHWLETLGIVLGFIATLPIKMGALVVEGIAAMIQAFITHLPQITNTWNAWLDGFKKFWMDAWNDMVNFVKNINWGNVLKGLGSGLGDAFHGFMKGAVAGIPGADEALKAAHIPGFASGGIVPGSLGTPMLAMVHGGERVIANGTGNSSQTINIDLSGTTFGNRNDIDYLVDQVKRAMGRQGELAQLGAI